MTCLNYQDESTERLQQELSGLSHGRQGGTGQLVDGNCLKQFRVLSVVWYMQEYLSFVRFHKNTERKRSFGFQIFVLFEPMWLECLHNSKLCFAGFRQVFLFHPLLREDLSFTWLNTKYYLTCFRLKPRCGVSMFQLCNKLFRLDSSQFGRTLSYNWIHTVYSKYDV